MGAYSEHQRKLIQRYYDRREEILIARLQELVSALYLAESERESIQLWKRVEKALAGLKVSESIRRRLLEVRDVEALARNVRGWLEEERSESRP